MSALSTSAGCEYPHLALEAPSPHRAGRQALFLPVPRFLILRALMLAFDTDSYFGAISSVQEAHAVLEASKQGVSPRFRRPEIGRAHV